MKIMSKCARFLYGPPKSYVMSPRKVMAQRADNLTAAIKGAERKYFPGGGQFIFTFINYNYGFLVKGDPRKAVHVPTYPADAIELLDDVRRMVKLPDVVNAADLGSGLGSFACSLSVYLDHLKMEKFHVTGFELSDELRPDAERIARKQEINNVSFVKKDFTELTADDLKAFNLIYAYKPFPKDFDTLMGRLLPRIAPGTLMIMRLCEEASILKCSSMFSPVFNPLFSKYQNEYALYIRTEKQPQQEGK